MDIATPGTDFIILDIRIEGYEHTADQLCASFKAIIFLYGIPVMPLLAELEWTR